MIEIPFLALLAFCVAGRNALAAADRAVKRRWSTAGEKDPLGNWIAPPGSSGSGGGGDKAAPHTASKPVVNINCEMGYSATSSMRTDSVKEPALSSLGGEPGLVLLRRVEWRGGKWLEIPDLSWE